MRSCSQIMSTAQKKKDKDDIASLPCNSKTHATLNKKICVNLYAEDLYFLTTRSEQKVTKIYEHYTFKQDTFKKDFVVMIRWPCKKDSKFSIIVILVMIVEIMSETTSFIYYMMILTKFLT